ncbi:amidase [Colletotrichum plurivorum]|uniref:Amidase n=1 Tax=Colletotrichum plurivorum TaxID=2175906 RepID=A0A8H6NGU9_9PEZI|nr:amidase [Colletotrichum plurivorum]
MRSTTLTAIALSSFFAAVTSRRSESIFTPSPTFRLENVTYFVSESTAYEINLTNGTQLLESLYEGSRSLLTVFATNETAINSQVLFSLSQQYDDIDDVWSPAFLDAVVVKAAAKSTLTVDGREWISDQGAKHLSIDLPQSLNPGPYVLDVRGQRLSIREVYRMYEDRLQAFTQGVIPVTGSTAFAAVSVLDPATQVLLVPVPSRIYSLHDPRPLAGLRMGVKDLFDMEGVKTSGGSRVYLEMYPERNKSAVAVAKLLELGAVAVGKTKTSQFAYGSEPWKWNDYKYPWNPRGDGWLNIAFSSSGSGAAIAGYEWIDFALGSDTGGSVRMPAALGGSYGIRPTHNGMDLTGTLPQSNPFDTAGIFARDPKLFARINRLWYADGPSQADKTFTSFPKRLLYPVDYLPLANPDAQAVFDSFIEILEDFGMKKETINVTSTLAESDKPYISDQAETGTLFMTTLMWDSWTQIGKDLVARWNATYPDAGYPPFDNETRSMWAWAQTTASQEDYDEAIKKKADFRAFAEDAFMRPSDETCSESIMVLESGTGGLPSYREEFLNRAPGAGFLYMTDPKPWLSPYRLSPLLSAPQIGIPIGQVPYQSVISLQTEYTPVVIDLLAHSGCDGMLLSLVEALAERGLIKTVKTGRTAF